MAILKYSFPDRFAGLRKAEAPDLQYAKRNLGIEVTSALSPRDEQITGESIKYWKVLLILGEGSILLFLVMTNGRTMMDVLNMSPILICQDIRSRTL